MPRLLVVIGALLGICLVLGALGSIVAAVGKPNRTSPVSVETTAKSDTATRVAKAIQAAAISPVQITAAQLLREYQDNSASADAKHRGTLLLVGGSIGWVDRDFVDEIVLHLRTGDNIDSIMATVNDADTKKAARLKNGEGVVLLCRGKTRMGSAALEDCRLQ
jgi:hypothetical protein